MSKVATDKVVKVTIEYKGKTYASTHKCTDGFVFIKGEKKALKELVNDGVKACLGDIVKAEGL